MLQLVEINPLNELDIATIHDLLGYTDTRSVEKWCKENKLPILTIGKRKYTVENFLEIFLEKELKIFIDANYTNPEEILGAVMNDDKAQLIDLLEVPVSKKVAKEFKEKKKRSSAADDFLKNIKAA